MNTLVPLYPAINDIYTYIQCVAIIMIIIPKNVVEIQAMYVHYGYDLWLSWKLDMLDGWPGYDYGYDYYYNYMYMCAVLERQDLGWPLHAHAK